MDARSEITNPAYWRQRAEEARRTAEQLSDPVSQQMMRDIAAAYDQLAEIAEARRAKERRD